MAARKATKRKKATAKKGRRWSGRVTRESHALALDVFTFRDPKKIARSLKRSAERSTVRKSAPYRSAASMLIFYINRAGKTCRRRAARCWSAPRTS